MIEYSPLSRDFQACWERARSIVQAYRSEAPEGCDPKNTWVAIGVGVAGLAVSAGSTAYASSQAKKASAKNASAIGNLNTTPVLLDKPAQVDPLQVLQQLYGANKANLGNAAEQASAVNKYNFSKIQKYYNQIAPGFSQRQGELGSLVSSYAQGGIPADVQSSIQRATAQQGIQAGYGYGTQGAQQGGVANLTARNLGLTSLDLSKYGISAGMQFQSNAKALLPNMTGLQDFLLNPQQVLGINQSNVQSQNQFALQNNLMQNQQIADQNKLAYQASQNQLAQQLQSAQMVGQLGQSVGGAISGLGSGMGSSAPATGGWGGNYANTATGVAPTGYASFNGSTIPRAQLA